MGSETFLGFDYGTHRIGVAVGDGVTRSARGLGALTEDWTAIGRLIDEWAPAACIVGLPLDEDDGECDMSRRARRFADALERRSGRPVHLCDERYSTRSAAEMLRGARASGAKSRRLRPGDKDSTAARLILEQWLADHAEDAA